MKNKSSFKLKILDFFLCFVSSTCVFADFSGDFEEAVFVKSKTGSALLLDKEGNLYTINNKSKKTAKIWWKCRQCRSVRDATKVKSSGNAITDGPYVISWSGEHNHIITENRMIIE